MGRQLRPILAMSLIIGTLGFSVAQAASPKDYRIQTKYICQANGVIVQSKQRLLSNGRRMEEIKFSAPAGGNQTLMFGNEQEYMLWPRTAKGTFEKSLNVLAKDKSGSYRIVQEVDMGSAQKTKTNMSITVKDVNGDDRPISCRIEMSWIKK